MLAYIPARGGSKRIPRKNLKPLGGRPIIAHVIATLKGLDVIDAVYVSTDDPEIAEVAEAAGALTLGLRAAQLSDDKSGFIDLIRHDMPRFCEAAGTTEVLFSLATAALVPADVYREAYAVWQAERPDIVMSCEKAYPWWAMVQKDDGFWTPLYPDKVLINSQDLPPALIDAGLFYVFDQAVVSGFESVKLVDRLRAFEVADAYIGDIDTLDDWALLEYKHAKLWEASR